MYGRAGASHAGGNRSVGGRHSAWLHCNPIFVILMIMMIIIMMMKVVMHRLVATLFLCDDDYDDDGD